MCRTEVTVVIVTYNHEKYIVKCLDSVFLQNTNFDFKVVVFDDCSTDDTCQVIRNYSQEIEIHRNSRNYGIGTNVGLARKSIETKYHIMFAGDDWFVSDTCFQDMYDYLETHPKCVAVGGWTDIYTNSEVYKRTLKSSDNELGLRTFLCGYNIHSDPLMVRNIFHNSFYDWMCRVNPKSDEPHEWLYILSNGNFGLIHQSIRAYRESGDVGESNYHSLYSYYDTLRIYRRFYQLFEKRLGMYGLTKYRYMIDQYRLIVSLLSDLIKKRDFSGVKDGIKIYSISDWFRFSLVMIFIHIGKGMYPQWLSRVIIRIHSNKYDLREVFRMVLSNYEGKSNC